MRKLLSFVIYLLISAGSFGQTITATGGAIPDNAVQTCYNMTVSGVGTINGTYGLASVCVNITHTWDADLKIVLIAPDGTQVILSANNGGSGDNYTNTCFSATAATSITTGSAPFTGSYQPQGTLGNINNGQNANGTWRICITDEVSSDSGTLLNWSLTFSNSPATPPPTMPSCSGNAPAANTCATATNVCNFNGYCGNTSASYTADTWTQLSNAFCGSIENNSFIKFTASATSASFNVWVTSSLWGDGIQMMFYEGGCGSGAVTSHGCYSPLAPTGTGAPAVVTATSLVVGNTYYLMFDGYAGDICNYVLSPVSGVSVLGITPTAPTICNGSSTTLTASGSTTTYSWSPATGLNTTSGATVTASPTTTTTYTVTGASAPGCPLTKTVTVTVTAVPSAPTVTSPVSYCQNATPAALNATGTGLLWYTAATGGTGSATAPTPSTATAGSTIYYVTQTVSSCESPRAAITVNVTATPTAPTVTTPVSYCQNATATALTATGTGLLWYAASTGGTGSATAPTPSTITTGSTIYYVSQTVSGCESPRAAITVNITAAPAAPTVTTPVTYCQNATGTALTATGTGLLWYTVATGGTGSATAPLPSTTTAGSTIYYVSQTVSGCESPRAAIAVNIAAAPAAPAVTSPVTYCQDATATTLTATGTGLLWYTVATGGTGSATAPIPSTTAAGSTIYYVSQTVSGCESPRAAITVNITAAPPLPTVTIPVTYCQNAMATALTATGTGLLWYATSTGGTGSATAPTPSTTTAGSTIYFVSQTVSGCESPRAAITVNITATPAAPTVTTPVSYCQNATATALTATGTGLLWYAASTGGTGSSTAPTPSTTTAGSTIYYVSQTVSGCESPRAAITVDITAAPAAPIITSPVTYCQNATATALTATGTALLWYTMATGGTGSATAPTPSTTAAGSTTYYVSQTVNGCESQRVAITVNITAAPAAPTITSPVTYCQNATATSLTATGSNIIWYAAATGGTGSATAPTPSTAIAGSTIYYVSQTVSGCESPRAAITVDVNATPAAPTVTSPITYCQNVTASTLTATGTALLWYATATGGTGSATAPTPSTTAAGSTTYYVSQTVNGCESPRAAIIVDITATPAAPTVTSPVAYCQNTAATQLIATGSNLLWYSAATGGSGSATAPTPSTTASGSTTYYVSQTISGCESARASISVDVTATAPAPTVTTPVTYCQNAAPTALTATGSNILWYAAATGGTGSATAPTPSTTTTGSTTYYVSQNIGCESPRTAITVNVTATPAAPIIISPVTYCQNATATALSATGSNLLWYATATGGTGSATAPIPSTTTAGSTTYYVSQTVSGCESSRAAITVDITTTPVAPTVISPLTYCQNAMATALTATGTNLLWYTSATGGTGSATAPLPSTIAAGSTTYYVSQTVGGCESPRAAITVDITATPVSPIATTPITYCQNATASVLTATGSNLLWYATATGGTGSATAPVPSTASAGTTTYYVSQTVSSCESPRATITVNVPATPTAPTVTTPVSYCQNETVAALTATGSNLLWYVAATGGTGSATAPTPSTSSPGSTIYYVSQTISTCESPRAAITVDINATPSAPTVISPVTYCQNATATTLTATGSNLLWYAAATGGTGSATAPIPSTTTAGNTIYYVSQTVSGCESPRSAITVNITAAPAAPTATTPVTFCQNATASTLTATGTGLLWYTAATGGTGSPTAPSPSTTIAGSSIYYVSQTISGCESQRVPITVNITATPAAPVITTPVTYCQNATATPLTATGSNLLWYVAATGGTGSATAPTPSTSSPGSTIYYVSQTISTCESPRAAITVDINAIPSAPTVISPVTYCQNATATTLTATGSNLLWYAAATGGTGSATAPIPSTTTAGSTIYYVSQTVSGCESPRASITVNITAAPAGPIVTSPVTYCQNATATALTATGSNLLWYATATGGTGSATAPTPSTAAAGSTTYYVSQTVSGCESPRTAITVNITATPSAPTVITPITYCQNAPATTLTATGTGLLWYPAATGGTGSATAPTPSTTIAGSTIFYVSQTVSGCESPRAAITINITATPAPPTVSTPITYCQNATATALTATGSNLLWYAAATGGMGSATAPIPSTTTAGSTIFYVSQTVNGCESSREAITVNTTAAPTAPLVATPVTYCQNATATALTATGSNLIWYTAATGGTGSTTAPTPSASTAGSTTYYVSQTVSGCESPRAAITVNITPTPLAPTVTSPLTYCQNATATALTAAGSNLLWYATATGGTGSATAPTPSSTTAGSTIYYVSQSINGCESPRTSITVNITATPPAPTVTTPITYCQNATATALTATGSNLLWYTAATGGAGSSTAPMPSTTAAGSTIYYVSQTVSTCESPRAAITVNITAAPATPTVATLVTYCQNATATTLTATGTNLLWYTAATGGTGSTVAPTPSTTASGSTIYFVSQTVSGCESPRATITVNVNATTSIPTTTSPVTYCQNATATALTATGSNLLWYAAATGGTGSATAPIPSTASAGTTTYYVSQTVSGCESPRTAITVNVNATPGTPTVSSPVTYCLNSTATALTATGTGLLWYAAVTGGTGSATAPIPSTTSVGTTIYYVSQSVNGCESPRAAITVDIVSTPSAPGVVTPVSFCESGPSAQLTASGTNLLWYTTATGGAGSATAPTPATTTAGSTNYYVSQSGAGCESQRAAITVNIIATPQPGVTPPITYCQNAPATQLTASGTNLLWYTTATGGTGSAIAPTPSTAVPGITNYFVSQTTGSCEGPRAQVTVAVIGLSVNIGSDTTICQGDTARFTPSVIPAADSYTWRSITPAVPNNTILAPTSINTQATPVDNVKYVLRATISGCNIEDTVQVNVRWKPIVDAGLPVAICTKDSVLLTGSFTHTTGPITTYAWTPAAGLNTPSAVQTWAHPSGSGWYRFTVTTDVAGYGCVFSVYDSVKLTVQPPVHAFAGNDTIAARNLPHQLHGSGGLTYTWSSPTALINNPYSQNPTTTLSNDANIYLKVQDAIGCTGYDSLFIKVYEGPTYYIPTAFTPNGDGLNDIFRVIPSGISITVYFRVFDRYGQMIFETNQWLKGWDGTFKGKQVPQGTYTWMVKGVDRNNKILELKGTVILIR